MHFSHRGLVDGSGFITILPKIYVFVIPGNARDSSTGFSKWKDATVGFANHDNSQASC